MYVAPGSSQKLLWKSAWRWIRLLSVLSIHCEIPTVSFARLSQLSNICHNVGDFHRDQMVTASSNRCAQNNTPPSFAHPFFFLLPCPPHPSQGNYLPQNPVFLGPQIYSFFSLRQPSEPGFGNGSGWGRPTGRKGKSFFSGARKR